ncbi:MAG: shikimate kinase, partial [Bacteroidales bacterium]|nr:shikimate kinase [Bacteroidales bacterium]
DGRTVPEIFTSEGEQVFREKEREALIEVCKEENVVISTGGGAPCWFNNMEIMVEKGETVYLMLENETLVGRLKVAAKDRPIVLGKTSEELHQYVRDLKEKFEHHYLKAKHHIDTTGQNTGELVDKIEKVLGNKDN